MSEIDAVRAAYESALARAEDAENRNKALTKQIEKLETQLANGDVGRISNKLVNAEKQVEHYKDCLRQKEQAYNDLVHAIDLRMRELLGADLFRAVAYEETES